MDKFAPRVVKGGLLLYDSGTVSNPSVRTDIHIFGIPAAMEALQLKNSRVQNMIMLGAFLKRKPLVLPDSLEVALQHVLPEKYHRMIPLNLEAIRLGASLVPAEITI
jgi:2-oxoglutarate ferredoxin oxidoreductase subunit gamma